MITDRIRLSVLEANTNRVLARDLVCKEPPKLRKNLSAPGNIQFTMDQGQFYLSSVGINWDNWKQWVVAELEIDGVRKIFTYGVVTNAKIDPASGDLAVTCDGPLAYAKGIPFLANYNPIAVDPYEIIQLFWAHLQSFSNANLELEVTPASSGTQMLPGYSYDGSILNFDFFAVFIRAVDFTDCSDYMTALARDIPFDMIEQAEWNEDRTAVNKKIVLGYPRAGFQQNYLSFRVGENVVQAEMADPPDIKRVSDVIIRGWLPGKVISSELSNADPTMLRRTIMEEDAYIESDERAAAFAKRRLTRRTIPDTMKTIVIDPNHPNAPWGSFDVGDSIYIEAPNYPWVGDFAQWHRVLSVAYDEKVGLMQLEVKVDGAWNYDPITYDPNYDQQPTSDPNRLANGYFGASLQGWVSLKGQWFRVADVVYQTQFDADSGSVRVDCDDHGEAFRSHRAQVTPGETVTLCCVVQYSGVASGVDDAFQLLGITSLNGDATVGETFVVAQVTHPTGTGGWHVLTRDWVVPVGINEVSLQFNVTDGVTAGVTWWTYARVFTAGQVVTP